MPNVVHQSLVRPVLYAGVNPVFFFLGGGALILAFGIFGFSPGFWTCAALTPPGFAVLAYLTRHDHLAVDVWARSLSYQDHYLPHAKAARGLVPRPPRTLPKG